MPQETDKIIYSCHRKTDKVVYFNVFQFSQFWNGFIDALNVNLNIFGVTDSFCDYQTPIAIWYLKTIFSFFVKFVDPIFHGLDPIFLKVGVQWTPVQRDLDGTLLASS